MAGEEDWEQLRLAESAGSTLVWIHRPCGGLVGPEYTTVHDDVCIANKE